LVRVCDPRTVIDQIRDPIVVVVEITGISLSITIEVGLVGISNRYTVVRRIQDAITIPVVSALAAFIAGVGTVVITAAGALIVAATGAVVVSTAGALIVAATGTAAATGTGAATRAAAAVIVFCGIFLFGALVIVLVIRIVVRERRRTALGPVASERRLPTGRTEYQDQHQQSNNPTCWIESFRHLSPPVSAVFRRLQDRFSGSPFRAVYGNKR
jgi:hypothetical protein